MFKMWSFRLYVIINKKDIQFVHELLDSPSYISNQFIILAVRSQFHGPGASAGVSVEDKYEVGCNQARSEARHREKTWRPHCTHRCIGYMIYCKFPKF